MVNQMKRYVSTVGVLAACSALIVTVASAAAPPPTSSPQRTTAEAWVGLMNVKNLRAACELQVEGQAKGDSAVGEPCGALPTEIHSNCPLARRGAKPPYRRSEIRAVSERIGEYTEEGPSRGFVRLKAEVKASKQWGALGLEQVGGAWRVTYLRYGSETLMPAGNVYQAWPPYYKLWVGNWCLTNHPRYENAMRGLSGGGAALGAGGGPSSPSR
jgi:hypothetical protein